MSYVTHQKNELRKGQLSYSNRSPRVPASWSQPGPKRIPVNSLMMHFLVPRFCRGLAGGGWVSQVSHPQSQTLALAPLRGTGGATRRTAMASDAQPPLVIVVPDYEVIEREGGDGKRHARYRIVCQESGETWSVMRRWTELRITVDALKIGAHGDTAPTSRPPTHARAIFAPAPASPVRLSRCRWAPLCTRVCRWWQRIRTSCGRPRCPASNRTHGGGSATRPSTPTSSRSAASRCRTCCRRWWACSASRSRTRRGRRLYLRC